MFYGPLTHSQSLDKSSKKGTKSSLFYHFLGEDDVVDVLLWMSVQEKITISDFWGFRGCLINYFRHVRANMLKSDFLFVLSTTFGG